MVTFGGSQLPASGSEQVMSASALLLLIATPQSKESQDFLQQLLKARDDAAALAKQAAADKATADATLKIVKDREAALEQKEASLQSKEALHFSNAKALAAKVAKLKEITGG